MTEAVVALLLNELEPSCLVETPSRDQPSALARRLLRDALRGGAAPVLSVEQVEQIARRVLRESA